MRFRTMPVRKSFAAVLCCLCVAGAVVVVRAWRSSSAEREARAIVDELGGKTMSAYPPDGWPADLAGKLMGRAPSDTPFVSASHYVNLSGRDVTPSDLDKVARLP